MTTTTQTHRRIAIGTALGEDAVVLRSLRGEETLGRPFLYRAELLSAEDLDASALLGTNATVRVSVGRDDGDAGYEPRYINGYVSALEQAPDVGRFRRYFAELVPWTWFLGRRTDCRIFQNKSVPEIIKEVFRAAGFSGFEESLTGSYEAWEYCVQYRESDLDFCQRLMEQEGIYYFFRHTDGAHKLVLCDDPSAHAAAAGAERLIFGARRRADAEGRVYDDEMMSSWHPRHTVQPGVYAHRDFDFTNPSTELLARAKNPREHENGGFEVYDYPGEYTTHARGETLASRRLEELQVECETFSGETTNRALVCGATFALEGHRTPGLNGEYLVTSASVSMQSDDAEAGGGQRGGTDFSTCAVRAIRARTGFRLRRTTQRPEIPGVQTAVVVGKPGSEITADEYGRVKVQFHWDRAAPGDETASCWVRVGQGVAGKRWGQMFLPRHGHEVLVEFLEGDPDRPIITGSVHNGANRPPYDPRKHGTISTIKTNSSKGGGGFNEIRFEDKKGEEQLFVHAQKNLDVRVLNDRFETVMHDRHLVVENDKFEHVKHERHEAVDADAFQAFGKDLHQSVNGKRAEFVKDSYSLKVDGDCNAKTGGDHTLGVTGELHIRADKIVLEAASGITFKSGGSNLVLDGNATLKGTSVTIDGGSTKISSGPGSSPASVSLGDLVAPTDATLAKDADKADPGEVAEVKARQREQGKGKYGEVKAPPFLPPAADVKDAPTSWIEIELVDDEDNPVPGERYEITLADGRVVRGTLDQSGFARVEGIEPGSCDITFPELDAEVWEPA